MANSQSVSQSFGYALFYGVCLEGEQQTDGTGNCFTAQRRNSNNNKKKPKKNNQRLSTFRLFSPGSELEFDEKGIKNQEVSNA